MDVSEILNEAFQAAKVVGIFVPQVQAALSLVDIGQRALQHFQATGSTEIPEELQRQFEEARSRRKSVEDDWQKFLNS